MLIERSKREARVFNLNDRDEEEAYNQIINDPAVNILEKRLIKHTETEQSGRDRTETTENHIMLEWETCSL